MSNLGAIGGYLVTGSGALFLVAGAMAATGTPVGMGSAGIAGLVLVLALGLAAVGSAAIGLAGPEPVGGRWLRGALVTVSLGLASVTGSAAVAGTMSHDPLESAPVIVLTLVGGWATLVGGIATIVLLLRRHGGARTVGRLFVGGLVLAIFSGLVANEVLPRASADTRVLRELMTLAAIAASSVMLVAWAGLGVLVVRSSRALGGLE